MKNKEGYILILAKLRASIRQCAVGGSFYFVGKS